MIESTHCLLPIIGCHRRLNYEDSSVPFRGSHKIKKTDRILHWLRDICGQPQDNKLWLFFSAYQGQSNKNKEITHEIWNGIVETNFMKQKRDCLGIIQVVQKNFLKIHLYFL